MDIKNYIMQVFGIEKDIAKLNSEIALLKANIKTLENVNLDKTKQINLINSTYHEINIRYELLQNEVKRVKQDLTDEKERSSTLFDENLSLSNKLTNLEVEVSNYKKQISELNDYITKLKVSPQAESEKEKFWNNKYPKANVEYYGRTWGQTTTMIPIDVRLLITPQDYHIHDILKTNNLYITDGDYERGAVKIYNWVRNNLYKYRLDENNYLVPEYWEFPFELLAMKQVKGEIALDCDSWANLLATLYIAAGVPAWKVRVTCGKCQLGYHSTNHLHSDIDNKYHHLNSTFGSSQLNKISEFPTTDKAFTSDQLGITGIWFSFNNQFAWNQFSTEARQSFEESKLMDKFIIKPI